MSDAANVGNWIAAATSVGSFLLIILKVSGRSEKREISPNPLVVKQEAEYATKNHIHSEYVTWPYCREAHQQASQSETKKLDDLKRQVESLGTSFQTTLNRHNEQAEERAAKLHDRIDPISKIVQSTSDRFDDHLKDHRTGRTSNG
jgi:hypothetical protein